MLGSVRACKSKCVKLTPGWGNRRSLDAWYAYASVSLLSRSLYRSHVLSTFFGPVLGAMMKQVCWHSRRSEAHRGLPEARPPTQNVMARGQSEARIYIIHVKTE